ncbi:uncharacterized protein LOC129717714 [Wyeomyia smithii]|uniref:uncharacterized protein LOC129717714 n=1 Tax=Wyeomyia smithii TaxID=174621 RepID=UPI002467ED2C|nr:uncharacterized protein LOC129717714 [Wyeomyia smithii]
MPPHKRKAAARSKNTVQANSLPQLSIVIDQNELNRLQVSSTAKDDSIIMLSSAENTLISTDPSLLMLSTVEMLRPSTRLGAIDMTLEETLRPSFRPSERPPPNMNADETNMSVMNVEQTPCIQRNRPKSSWVNRRTEVPAAVAPEIENEPVRPSRNRKPNRNIFSDNFQSIAKRKTTTNTSKQQRVITDSERKSLNVDETNLNATPVNSNTHTSIIKTRSASRKANLKSQGGLKLQDKPLATPETDDDRGEPNTQTTKKGRARRNAVKQKKNESNRTQTSKSSRTKGKNVQNPAIANDIAAEKNKGKEPLEKESQREVQPIRESEQQQNISSQLAEENHVPTRGEPIIQTTKKGRTRQKALKQNMNESNRIQTSKPSRTKGKNALNSALANENIAAEPLRNETQCEVQPITNSTQQQNVSSQLTEENGASFESVSSSQLDVPPTESEKSMESHQFSYVSVRRRPKVVTPRSVAATEAEIDKSLRNKSSQNSLVVAEIDAAINECANQPLASPAVEYVSRRRRKSQRIPDEPSSFKPSDSQQTLLVEVPLEDEVSRVADKISSNVSRRKRPNLTSHSDRSSIDVEKTTKITNEGSLEIERTLPSNLSEKSVSIILNRIDIPAENESEPVVTDNNRVTIRSRSRTRQNLPASASPFPKGIHQQISNSSPNRGYRTRSNSVPRSSTVPIVRGRSRTRQVHEATISNSAKDVNSQGDTIEPRNSRTRSRVRSKSALRSNVTSQAPDDTYQASDFSAKQSTNSITTRFRTRSRSILRTNLEPPVTRSRSVPRNALLSPITKQPPTSDSSHIPVYRRQAEEGGKSAQSKDATKFENLIVQPAPVDDDIYAFDSPSQTPPLEGETVAKKRGTARKKPNSSTTRKRTTPAKKAHHMVFGTDMAKIKKVVSRIGGGPVHHPKSANEILPTAKLAALVLRPTSPRIQNPTERSVSPASSHPDDHHFDNDVDIENIPEVALSPPKMPKPHQQTFPQQKDPAEPTPNKTLSFSPLGASSPWRVQNENILPKTFYFSRSKDLLPSYESDVVIRHDDNRAKSPVKELEVTVTPAPARKTPPTNTVPSSAPPEIVFRGIQKSYEQLKVTSAMSEKLISAMRKYKEDVHNQTALFSKGPDGLSEDERLIAKFREYEENMKKTYQKLRQWYERSQRTLTHSMQAIKQVSTLPKTQAQKEVLQNFHRHSERFVTMINELESAMNDSNVENIAPSKSTETRSVKHPSKDIILSERDINNPYRSPLKTLDILNVPRNFSPVKSPLVKAAFNAFSSSGKQNSISKSRDRFSILSLTKRPISRHGVRPPTTEPSSVIEIGDTLVDPDPQNSSHSSSDAQGINQQRSPEPNRDLFGFEADDNTDDFFVEPTPVKITKDTLKERLKSVRKMLPVRPTKTQSRPQRMPKVIGSPTKLRSVQNVFASSTPVAVGKRTQTNRDEELNVSAIPDKSVVNSEEHQEPPTGESVNPPLVLFDEPEQEVFSNSLSCVNRTYSRIPRRNPKRKRNIYLADLGLSEDDDEEDGDGDDGGRTEAVQTEDEDANVDLRKQHNKKRRIVTNRKKKTVEQSKEFKKFVDEFNSMCEEVNRYQLIVE